MIFNVYIPPFHYPCSRSLSGFYHPLSPPSSPLSYSNCTFPSQVSLDQLRNYRRRQIYSTLHIVGVAGAGSRACSEQPGSGGGEWAMPLHRHTHCRCPHRPGRTVDNCFQCENKAWPGHTLLIGRRVKCRPQVAQRAPCLGLR